jgi:hypothetical protein
MKVESIRNSEGYWINTEVFKEEANHFEKHGYYCPDPWGSPSWQMYWEEQFRRTQEGYETGGVKITGDHYFYLNFCPILRVEKNASGRKAKKIENFPDFWDGDYNYFWATEIAYNGIDKAELEKLKLHISIQEEYLNGGRHIIVGKSRRKGYSFKNASKVVNKYNNTRNSLSIIGAFDKKYLYPEGTMGMATNYINFLNEHTGWRKNRDYVDKQEHKRASFKEVMNGVAIEKGYMSQIMALTFKDNPDIARGKDAAYVLLEEAGRFPNLKDSYMATEPTLKAGKYVTGQILIFGTGGDMESGTVDFAEMFYDPITYNLMPFINIWDDNAENTNCGFFHPVFWNMDGFYDKTGNSLIKDAIDFEKKERDVIIKNSSNGVNVIQSRVQEYPFNPSEAFLTVSTNDFPITELRNRLNIVEREQIYYKKGQAVNFIKGEDGKVKALPDLKNELQPVWHYKPKINELNGAPVIFEYPIPNSPKGLYKMGYDPYQQDQSGGVSLGAVYVYKSNSVFSFTRNKIVASYVGRMKTVDDTHRVVEMLAELYNAEIMHENMIRDVKGYFEKKRKLHLLAAQPDAVISKTIKNSKVSRVYGIHMNNELKDAGAKYIKQWLLQERDVDENGNIILNLDTIEDPGLLEELILFNKKGNFDRVMAFMMIMFQIEEEGEKQYSDKLEKNKAAKYLIDNYKSWFKNSNKQATI